MNSGEQESQSPKNKQKRKAARGRGKVPLSGQSFKDIKLMRRESELLGSSEVRAWLGRLPPVRLCSSLLCLPRGRFRSNGLRSYQRRGWHDVICFAHTPLPSPTPTPALGTKAGTAQRGATSQEQHPVLHSIPDLKGPSERAQESCMVNGKIWVWACSFQYVPHRKPHSIALVFNFWYVHFKTWERPSLTGPEPRVLLY